MILKRELSCLSTNRKFEKIKEDKYKQLRSSRQSEKSEQGVMHTAVKDEVLGSILGSNKSKQSVSLLISLQLKAETRLTKHRLMKQ